MKKVKQKISILLLLMSTLLCAISAVHAWDSAGLLTSVTNQNPDPATTGDVVEIRISLQNVGNSPVSNLIAEFIPTYPFESIAGENPVQQLGSIQAYQGQYDTSTIKIVKFRVRISGDSSAGQYPFKVRFYNGDDPSSYTEKSFQIAVGNKENAKSITIDTTKLIPGKETNVTFTINNMGNSPLKSIVFTWENSDKVILPVGSDNTKYIEQLGAGKSAELHYTVVADSSASAGLYKLDLTLTYKDTANGSNSKLTTTAGMYVGGQTDFDVSYSDSTNGAISFSIANVGSNPATSVSVSIPDQRGWRTTGSSSSIVGNLNKGDYTIVSFKLTSTTNLNGSALGSVRQRNSSSAGSSVEQAGTQGQFAGQFQRPNMLNASSPDSIILRITYTDTTGARIVVDKELRLSLQNMGSTSFGQRSGAATTTNTSFLSTYKWELVGLVVIVLAIYMYVWRKKRKLMMDETPSSFEASTKNGSFKLKKK